MKLVIFDVDGTLVDSQNFIVEAQTRAFTALGLVPPPRETMLSIVGLSLVRAFEVLVPGGPAEELAAGYRAAWQQMRLDPAFGDRLYPGACEAVETLAQRKDARLGIATGKSQKGVQHLFDEQGWHHLFASVQTSDLHPSKPDPSMILAALAQTGTAPQDAVIVGDTEFDMAMGRAAGVRRIGVTWGYHPTARLIEGGAEHLVDDFAQLTRLLEQNFFQD